MVDKDILLDILWWACFTVMSIVGLGLSVAILYVSIVDG